MKILHIVQSLKGGPATYFAETIPAMRAELGEDQVWMLIPEDDLDELPLELREIGVLTFPTRARNPVALAQFSLAAAGAVSKLRPAVVHLHSTFAGLLTRPWLSLLPRRPAIVYCPHGWAFEMEGTRTRKALIAQAERLLSYGTDRIINISDSEAAAARGRRVGTDRSVTFYNAVSDPGLPEMSKPEARCLLGLAAEKTAVLFVGRFDRQKGLDLALEAMELVDRQHFEFCIAGGFVTAEESDRSRLSESIHRSSSTKLLGWVPRHELQMWFYAADVLIVPSRWEGFGLVAIEAMRMGTPVLASPVGGLLDIVEDRVSGRIASAIEAVAFASILSEERRENWADYGFGARARFEQRFHADALNSKLVDLYRELERDRRSR